mmetsp:Transcript_2174/g.5127  ORF Transcript_2174/g.5127 Transcript_2174/m.5127 type:complete len:354 (-) Transcript_2174:2761-3822(-)
MVCCSTRFWAVAVVVAGVFAASLPTLMSALLKHMFTAPNQEPWPYGNLRLINCSGIPAQPLNSAERIAELNKNFKHKDNDVWIVSYVKSGTTWTIGILAALYQHPAAEYSGNLQKTTRTFCPQPELPDLGWGDDGFGHSMEELNEWPSPRCFKSHWPNQDFMLNAKDSKYVYVLRNARDQMISHWNQVWGMGFHYGTTEMTFEGGWSSFVNDWLDGNVENGKWIDHVAGWYERSLNDPEHVMVVRYEDLKRDTQQTVQKIASFVGVETVSPEEMRKVLQLTSFDKMKEADENDVGLQFMRWLGVLRKKHIRQGETGSKSELVLTDAQLQIFKQEYQAKLEPLGMPWEWVFQES